MSNEVAFVSMAKVPATVRPYMAAEPGHQPADSAIEGGDSSEIEKHIELCAECERIAIQIHPERSPAAACANPRDSKTFGHL